MKEQVKKLIEQLKIQIEENLKSLKLAEQEIKVLINSPVSSERSAKLALLFDKNKKILSENQDSLNIQLKLINYLNKYYSIKLFNEHKSFNIKDETEQYFVDNNQLENDILHSSNESIYLRILNQTLMGDLIYNSDHPMFDNQDFYKDLMDEYIRVENYEMCVLINRIKGSTAP